MTIGFPGKTSKRRRFPWGKFPIPISWVLVPTIWTRSGDEEPNSNALLETSDADEDEDSGQIFRWIPAGLHVPETGRPVLT